MLGEPHVAEGPQAKLVEAGDLGEGVIGAAMGVAGQIGQTAEVTEDGHGDLGSEGGFEIEHGEDAALEEPLPSYARSA